MKKLDNKVALITGSSIGIGKAIAEAFAQEGAEVIIVSHNSKEEGETTAKRINALGGKAIYFQADLSNQEGVDFLFNNISRYYSSIDILVNNVGHAFSTSFDEMSYDTFRRDIDSNLMSTVLCSKKIKEFMDKGHIINTTSIRGIDYAGRTQLMGYSAAKAALNSFTKNLALQYAPNILVNAVAPGFVWTEALSKTENELLEKWKKTIPIKRFIKPNELAEVYVMLATSEIFTGSVVVVDGGYTLLEKI